jgi:hypothetical protein
VDRCNAVCLGEVTVCVRHDNGKHGTCGDGGPLFDSTLGAPPCEGGSCGPEDCIPDPDDVGACDDDAVPAAVTARLERARDLVSRGQGHGKKLGRAAAKQLAKAGKRAARAAKHGELSDDCAAALGDVLEGAGACVACRAE